jgi:hypothetical protein
MWFFYITDWVWQDYFSPQGLNLFFYLVIIAILLKWFKTSQATSTRFLTRLLSLRMAAWREARRPRRFFTTLKDASAHIFTALKDASAHPRETRSKIAARLNAIVAIAPQTWMAISDTRLTPVENRKRVALLVALIAVFALSIVSHPVTPFFVLLSVGALVFSGQCTPRWLPFLMVAMILGWDLTVARPYMAGHLSADLAAFGNLRNAASANLTDRLATGSAQHHFITQTRVVITAAIWGLAILGVALRWGHWFAVDFRKRLESRVALRWRRWFAIDFQKRLESRVAHDLPYLMLAIMPLFMIVAQPYGGEMAMRSYLLSLPFVTFFAATTFFTPTSEVLARLLKIKMVSRLSMNEVITRAVKIKVIPRSYIKPVAMIAAACLLLASFMFARYGNERADFITYNEVDAVSYLYSVAPAHSLLLEGWTGTPWRYQDLELYEYSSPYDQTNGADLLRQHNISSLVSAATNRRFPGVYLIVTHSQMAQAELFSGVPPSAFASIEQQLLASGRVVQIYSNPDAVILMFLPPNQISQSPPILTVPIRQLQ